MKLVTTLLCVSLILGVAFANPLPKRAWRPSNPRESRRKVTDDITQDGSKSNETGKFLFDLSRPFMLFWFFCFFMFNSDRTSVGQ